MNKLYENTTGRLVFRIILTLVAIVAFILGFRGTKPIALYFTNWSVWYAGTMTFITMIGTLMSRSGNDKILDNGIYRFFKFSAQVMIFATFVVSSFVLPDKIWTSGFWTLNGAFKHCFLPLMYIADGILCDKRNSYKIGYIFFGLIPPISYWVILVTRFVNYRNSIGGAIPESEWYRYYPYGFCNIDNGHTLTFLICLLAGIAVALILTGFVFYALNRKKTK